MAVYYIIEAVLESTLGVGASYFQLLFRNLGFSQTITGFLIATGELGTIIMPLAIGFFAGKKIKEKYVMSLCGLSSAFLMYFTFHSKSMALMMFTFFLLDGLLHSLSPMADSYVNRQFSDAPEKYGPIRSIGTLGYVITLTTFSVISFPNEKNNNQIIWTAIVFYIIFAFVTLLYPPIKQNSSLQPVNSQNDCSGLEKEKKPLAPFFIYVGFSRFAMAAVDKLLPSYMTEVLNVGSWFTALIALGAAVEFFVLMFGGHLISKYKIKPLTLINISCIAVTVRLLGYYFFKSIVPFILFQTLHGACFGLYQLGVTRYLTQNVERNSIQRAMSMLWSFGVYLPYTLGALIGGYIIDNFGYNVLFLSYSVFPLIALVFFNSFKKHF